MLHWRRPIWQAAVRLIVGVGCAVSCILADAQPAATEPTPGPAPVVDSAPGENASPEAETSTEPGPSARPAEAETSDVPPSSGEDASPPPASPPPAADTPVAAGPVPSESRYPDAAEVFSCSFDERADPNYDGWPGGWTRRRGPGFPHYVAARIGEVPGPDGNPAFQFDLNGGAAAVQSPAVEVESQASYVLEVQVQIEGLKHDEVYCSITWLDEARQPLETVESQRWRTTTGWQALRLGPLSPGQRRARFAVIGLHVAPTDDQDLRGTVRFDDVWLARLPRIDVLTERRQKVFSDPAEVAVHCRVSGLTESVSQVRFELFDVEHQRIGLAEYPMGSGGAGEVDRGLIRESRTGAERTITWQPALDQNGFYQVEVTLGSREKSVHRRDLSLVVVEPERAAIGGEFGWSLPDGPEPLGWNELAPLLGHAGVSWAKFPVWVPEEQVDELSRFADRLSALGIQSVGLLGSPPEEIRQRLSLSAAASAADIFTAAPESNPTDGSGVTLDNWFALLEPTLVRLSLRVRWWQLGLDDDLSFFGYPNLAAKVTQIKQALDQIGQDANLGLAWSWLYEPPPGEDPPWRFLAMSAEPPLTPAELTHYLSATRKVGAARWAVTPALPPGAYSTTQRAADLAQRMVAAKAQGAERVFLPDPFDSERGVMRPDGSPGELFLTWRTLALALAGTSYLGQLILPSGAENHIFYRDGATVMVAWHHEPTDEELFLRPEAAQLDLWGRRSAIPRQGEQARLRLGPLPTIVTGLDEAVTRLQLSLSLDKQQLVNIPDLPQRVTTTLAGAFEQGASGRIRVTTPPGWRVRPDTVDVSLTSSEAVRRPLDVILGFDAETGRKLLRFDFDVTADRRYQFSAYRWLEVGLGDVEVELSTQLNEFGDLEVEQRLTNHGASPISYNCDLFVPERRRQRIQIVRQPPGQVVRVFRVRNGQELIGKTLVLRAQEIGGRRVLNHRVVARP